MEVMTITFLLSFDPAMNKFLFVMTSRDPGCFEGNKTVVKA